MRSVLQALLRLLQFRIYPPLREASVQAMADRIYSGAAQHRPSFLEDEEEISDIHSIH
jgi:hypothetical protein